MAGERAEFEGFVEARWGALVRYAYSLTGDRGVAEDVVQLALERTWRRWRHVRQEGAEAYVRKAVARLVISRWKRRRVEEVPLAYDAAEQASAEEGVLLRDALWRELRGLPPRMRAVLVLLRYVEDLTEAQTAAVLGCSVGNVKSQCSRGLAKLRARVDVIEGLAENGAGR